MDRRCLSQPLPLSFLNCLAALSTSRFPVFGPFQPRNFSSFFSVRQSQRKTSRSLTDLLGQFARVGFGLLAVRMPRDGNDAVIAHGVFAILSLHDLKNTNDFALHHETWRGCGVMQD
jgi:hypothetical protein